MEKDTSRCQPVASSHGDGARCRASSEKTWLLSPPFARGCAALTATTDGLTTLPALRHIHGKEAQQGGASPHSNPSPVKPPSAMLNMNLALNPFLSSFRLSSISSRASLSPFKRLSSGSSLFVSSAASHKRQNGGNVAEGYDTEWRLKRSQLHSPASHTWLVFLIFVFVWRRGGVSFL